ncbi:FtsQ-type POTRA domain-containing protein [Paramicrobacterium chengjingii]|uniref:FtsQ-type POTRA domain-containing protein n=1 Tax=Paramicrobacterium chengjingii TaxID=2769067 RepID=A0ABX6YNL7_9MICO|nr:FtsQ-type POTRA domain-containing protein [Microbacterium chengjingii]QPZ39872.1 FtsQ-type POTRA domain-containing protein [Microbacterium chengjingii]
MKRPGGFTPPQRPDEEKTPAEDEPAPVSFLGRFRGRDAEPADADGAVAESAHDNAAGTDAVDAGTRGTWSLRKAVRERKRVERSEVRRFTARQRRRRRNTWISLCAILVVAIGAVATAYSPVMAVRTITVEGATLVNSDGIVTDLQSQIGTPLPLVDQRAIKASLVKYPLIQSYTVEAVPPSTLIVRLVEREPLGLVDSGTGFALVDAAGVTLRTSEKRIDGFPIIDTDADPESRGFQAAVAVLRALPDEVRAAVDTVSATTRDDVVLVFADSGAEVRWGSAEDSALKARALTELMSAYPPDNVSLYDVSSAENVVVKPR